MVAHWQDKNLTCSAANVSARNSCWKSLSSCNTSLWGQLQPHRNCHKHSSNMEGESSSRSLQTTCLTLPGPGSNYSLTSLEICSNAVEDMLKTRYLILSFSLSQEIVFFQHFLIVDFLTFNCSFFFLWTLRFVSDFLKGVLISAEYRELICC